MKVVEEFKQGTDLVGCVEQTGLWPSKFQPTVISIKELCSVAEMEHGSLHEQFQGSGAGELLNKFGRRPCRSVGRAYPHF